MTRKTWIALGMALALIVLLLAAAFYASPWWSVHQLRQAARERDVDAILARVDQPALRKSVRLALGFRLAETQPSATEMLDTITESVTSPTLVMTMLMQGHPSRALNRAAPLMPAQIEAPADAWSAQLHYLDRSTVEVRAADAPDAGGFILRRKGWFDWKLSGLKMPE